MNSTEFVNIVVSALLDRKAYDIIKIDVREKSPVTDYFVVASARSSSGHRALAEHVEDKVSNAGYSVLRKDGMQDARWIVQDYGDVILHLFNDETRLFYHFDRLWGEGEKIENPD